MLHSELNTITKDGDVFISEIPDMNMKQNVLTFILLSFYDGRERMQLSAALLGLSTGYKLQ